MSFSTEKDVFFNEFLSYRCASAIKSSRVLGKISWSAMVTKTQLLPEKVPGAQKVRGHENGIPQNLSILLILHHWCAFGSFPGLHYGLRWFSPARAERSALGEHYSGKQQNGAYSTKNDVHFCYFLAYSAPSAIKCTPDFLEKSSAT